MTLILTVASNRYALQVGDRLVTSGGTQYDPFANKSVLFITRDAVVTASYTGLAYVDRVPTDEWIANALAGCTLMPQGTRAAFRTQSTLLYSDDIGRCVNRLSAELKRAFARRSPPRRVEEVAIAGWQVRKRRWWPLLWALGAEEGFRRSQLSRHWKRGEYRLVAIPAEALTAGAWSMLKPKLPRVVASADATEDLLVQTMRQHAGLLSMGSGPDVRAPPEYHVEWLERLRRERHRHIRLAKPSIAVRAS
jgi:hypothetical protein